MLYQFHCQSKERRIRILQTGRFDVMQQSFLNFAGDKNHIVFVGESDQHPRMTPEKSERERRKKFIRDFLHGKHKKKEGGNEQILVVPEPEEVLDSHRYGCDEFGAILYETKEDAAYPIPVEEQVLSEFRYRRDKDVDFKPVECMNGKEKIKKWLKTMF
ncbi:hypothetical protein C8Q75DRAFT_737902 [Abortiporus biennis]|nr:hypothetical protein C8Q75DRAFT_737902 [Abortiporus biennis]